MLLYCVLQFFLNPSAEGRATISDVTCCPAARVTKAKKFRNSKTEILTIHTEVSMAFWSTPRGGLLTSSETAAVIRFAHPPNRLVRCQGRLPLRII
jgi:hypothetical protein